MIHEQPTTRRWITAMFLVGVVMFALLVLRVEISDRNIDRDAAKIEDLEAIETRFVSAAIQDCVRTNAILREVVDLLKDDNRLDAMTYVALLPNATPDDRARVAAFREQVRQRGERIAERPEFDPIDCAALRTRLEAT